jgi:hypothetical protein
MPDGCIVYVHSILLAGSTNQHSIAETPFGESVWNDLHALMRQILSYILKGYNMTNFVETRTTRDGAASVLSDVTLNWVKIVTPVPGYNGGKPEYNLQIATATADQAQAWSEIMPNLKVVAEGLTTFNLKRPSFLGAPAAVMEDGDLMTVEARRTIGNGSVGDVKISHKKHPKTGRPYVCLEAIKVKKLVEYVADTADYSDDFDF